MTLQGARRALPAPSGAAPIPAAAGVGLRLPHHAVLRAERPGAAWLEAHPENYMSPALAEELVQIADHYPMSLHAVGMSLGSACGLDHDHLLRLKALERAVRPALMSDHLSWSRAAAAEGPLALPDLLPLPYTEEALAVVIANVDRAQAVLDRRILLENPSTYLSFARQALTEAQFLAAVVSATGCGVLLDVKAPILSRLYRPICGPSPQTRSARFIWPGTRCAIWARAGRCGSTTTARRCGPRSGRFTR
jgi:uncharacterized protein (UPF0276 family)